MKYLNLTKPTEQEYYRIYETIFYFLIKKLEKTTDDVEHTLHALAILSNTSSSNILLAANKLTDPLLEPTKMDIAITMAYIQMPIRDITRDYLHHTTYYKYVYTYFDMESTEPRIKNRLDITISQEIVKLITYIRKTFNAYDIARKGIIYDTER